MVRHRTLIATPEAGIAVRLTLDPPISQEIFERLTTEANHAAHVPLSGTLGIRQVAGTADAVEIHLDPLDGSSIRLDQLLAGLRKQSSPLGSPVSAYVTATLARTLTEIHRSVGVDGTARVHGFVHKGSVLISSSGSVSLVGSGFPALEALLLPRPNREADRFRFLAPEAARGEPLDPRADIYALGVLYYEMLAGRAYRDALTASAICQRAIEGGTPELPGALPDPRPSLLDLLGRALAPHRDARFGSGVAFASAIEEELRATGQIDQGATTLARMTREFVPVEMERGPNVLLSCETDPETFESSLSRRTAPVRIPTNTPTAPAPPAQADLIAKTVPPDLSSSERPTDAWSSVLGAQEEPEHPHDPPATTKEIPPSSPDPSLSLPTEEAKPTLGSRNPLLDLEATKPAGPYNSQPFQVPERTKKILKYVLVVVGFLVMGGIAIYFMDRLENINEIDLPKPILPPGVYMESHPDAAVVSDSGTQEHVEPEKKPIGLLSVLSQPSGATVELDGGYIGKTPLVMRHDFKKKSYELSVLADGHLPWRKTVRPDQELKSISVMAILEKIKKRR